MECFGRKDGRVKINGQRIEIGEITQRLLDSKGIIEAIALTYTLRNSHHIGAVICVVYTTAGSEAKRDYLVSLGVDCVANSHNESFVNTIMNHSQGQKMDIILNSLTGSLIDASLEILAPQGRFLELGSKDIVEDRALPMRFFAHGGSFIPINFHAAYNNIQHYYHYY